MIQTSDQKVTGLKMWPAILHCKCPRCRVGDIYARPAYTFGGQKMYEGCSHCGFTYEREPGYFYAAMYVDYGFIVGELLTTALSISFLSGGTYPWIYIGVMLSVVALLAPLNYRYSRVLLLHWLTPGIHYHPELNAMEAVIQEKLG